MAINSSNTIPSFCKNCTHRFVCSIQDNIREQDKDIKEFNSSNVSSQQSISSTGYICRYKAIDSTV